MTPALLGDALDLATLLEPSWPAAEEANAEAGIPTAANIGHARIGERGLLNADDRALVRIVRLGVRTAMLGYHNSGAVHYSQLPDRWEAINGHLRGYKGQFPKHADCSSYVTWCLWDATLAYHPRDFVNGSHWQSGHTGTLVKHGREVRGRLRPLDLVFYGDEGWRPGHVAIVVQGGTLDTAKVVSHGSEAGPFLLPARYRRDTAIGGWLPRRYVH